MPMAARKELPEYERPPLNEVVFGVQFEPLRALRAAHLGLFWDRIRDRYPYSEEHVPVAHLVEKPELSLTRQPEGDIVFDSIPLIPRCWYLDESKLQLVQVQPDRFLRNWRQLEGKEAYPRYGYLLEQFQSEWQAFLKFLDEERIGPPITDQCELTYINHIPQGEGWAEAADLAKVFRIFSQTCDFEMLPGAEAASWKLAFLLPDGRGRLHVQLKQGVRNRDRRPIFALDLTARGEPKSHYAEDVKSWFNLAHEWVVRGFTDLTTPEMHKLWKKSK